MKFKLTEDEIKLLIEFKNNHKCTNKEIKSAIGGKYSYTFTPTGLCIFASVKCNACGSELTLTNMEML